MAKYHKWKSRSSQTPCKSNSCIEQLLLEQRNLSKPKEKALFFSDNLDLIEPPYMLKDCLKAVKRIKQAIVNNEKIALYGDYDVDGVTALVILAEALEELNYTNFISYIPHRINEGYGLNQSALTELAKQGVKLIITVDCGINATVESSLATKLNLDLIITDHHHVPEIPPKALAIINPNQKDCYSADKYLAGAGIAWKLGWALLSLGKKIPVFSLKQLDLVALATIADMAPLSGENRILVKNGCLRIQYSQRPGLKALLDISSTKEELIDAEIIGFRLAPRLNATGRLSHAKTSYNLLKTRDISYAFALAAELESQNQQRKIITNRCLNEALQKINSAKKTKVIMVKQADWPSGIIGLLASKLSEQFARPAIVLSLKENSWRGSARSLDYFHITEALNKVSPFLERFGGHAKAAGFSVSMEKINSFEQEFLALAQEQISDEWLVPTLLYDVEIVAPLLHWDLLNLIEKFAPFGSENTKPILVSSNLELLDLKLVGNTKKHVKFKFLAGNNILDAISFDFADYLEPHLKPGDSIKAAYYLESNKWNGVQTLQLNILDLHKNKK